MRYRVLVLVGSVIVSVVTPEKIVIVAGVGVLNSIISILGQVKDEEGNE